MEATDQALGYAHQTGDPRLMSYVFMRKSNIATDCVNAELGLELAIAALSTSDSFSAHLRAVSLRQQANAYAILGDRDNCARAVDAALDEVAGTAVSPDELAAYCTTPYVEMEAATCWLRLDHPNIAIEIYEQGLSEWPALLRRDRGLCLSRLARAHAAIGNVSQACTVAADAIEVAQRTRSARIATELRAVRRQLQPWRSDGTVQELTASLSALTNRHD
jgi:hypothetical protein